VDHNVRREGGGLSSEFRVLVETLTENIVSKGIQKVPFPCMTVPNGTSHLTNYGVKFSTIHRENVSGGLGVVQQECYRLRNRYISIYI